MKMQDILLTEDATVKQAVEILENLRCRNVYVVKGKKILASVSDGDIRRYTLREGNIQDNISKVANYNPRVYNEFEKTKWTEDFESSERYSVPIVNMNNEIVGIVFRDGTVLRDYEQMGIPVVMMAGGKGVRLHPYTKILPKALIPVGDIPISEHIINRFHAYGCDEFYLIVNHKRAMIQAYFESIEKAYRLHYIEEREALGTGGGLSLLKGQITGDFVLTNCDILIDADYAAIYKMHQKKNNFITMVLSRYTQKVAYGVVEIDGENNYLGVTEKPEFSYLINTGVYIVNQRVIEELPDKLEIDFPNIIEKYRASGERIGCYIVNESAYMDMGQIEELEKMKEKLGVG